MTVNLYFGATLIHALRICLRSLMVKETDSPVVPPTNTALTPVLCKYEAWLSMIDGLICLISLNGVNTAATNPSILSFLTANLFSIVGVDFSSSRLLMIFSMISSAMISFVTKSFDRLTESS